MQGRVFWLLGAVYSGFLPVGMAVYGICRCGQKDALAVKYLCGCVGKIDRFQKGSCFSTGSFCLKRLTDSLRLGKPSFFQII